MKTIMSRSPHESSFSFSRRHFQRIIARVELAAKISSADGDGNANGDGDGDGDSLYTAPPSSTPPASKPGPISRFKSVLCSAIWTRSNRGPLGARVTGTVFGPRRGHVRFAFQGDPRAGPALLVELAMPTASLVREMASGLVRVALECEAGRCSGSRLSEERTWRAYCNGKKCGYAARRDCAAADWRVLQALQPVSMGAGVLPPPDKAAAGDGDGDGCREEVMYMRARFERVVGSKDSEAYYMMNPDGNGGPELSLYLLRS